MNCLSAALPCRLGAESIPRTILLSAVVQRQLIVIASIQAPRNKIDNSIYYGIKTGYNDAFIIDDSIRDRLITQDPRSAEIIRPLLRGRDIQRYRANWAGRWLITAHNGFGDVPAINIQDYPAIKNHLDQYYDRLATRQDKGTTLYNLRNCAYQGEFFREKLFWIALSQHGRFAYAKQGEMYCVNSAYMLTGAPIKFLCGILNSQLVDWFMQNTALISGMGVTQWIRSAVEMIPIPLSPNTDSETLIDCVDRILRALDSRDTENATEFENQVNAMVYKLYGLNDVDIAAVSRY